MFDSQIPEEDDVSKPAHSNDETMEDFELDRVLENDEVDLFLDKNAGLDFNSAAEKMITALKERRGTKINYPEVRAVLRFIARNSR